MVVERIWPDSTVVCIATGPSLTAADVDYCRGKARVIAINDAYRLAPWADVLYACDGIWWSWHPDALQFAGLKFGITVSQKRMPQVVPLKATGETGLEIADRSGVRTASNSGYQAINLAVHLGAKRILLLGYDMQQLGEKAHFFGAHPNRRRPLFKRCLAAFPTIVEPLKDLGVEVINCTRETALTCFPKASLESALRVEVAA